MAVELLKSTSLTNLDAGPPLANSQGEGAAANLKVIDDFLVAPAASSIGSVFRILRVPTTAKVKSLWLEAEAQGAGAFDVGVYYSASVNDSPGAAALGGVVVDADFFASAVSNAAAIAGSEIVNESGVYTLDERKLPLWQAVGLTADPGGYFDIVATVTTAITTGTGRIGLRASFAK